MSTYKTRAIILSSYPYRDHDRIVTFFSGEFGKIDARARGLRKITSKLAGHLEPFIETELLLASGKRWDILAGSKTLNPQTAIRSDIEKISSASVCVEAVKLITKPLSSDFRIYNFLYEALEKIENSSSISEYRGIVFSFLWNIISVAGFKAEMNRCIHCREIIENGSFSFEGGGMLCDKCENRDIMSKHINFKTIFYLKSCNLKDNDSQEICERFWANIVDYRPLNSLKFFSAL